ncbi:hypothetical protein [Pseudomonas aeruginosa]|uniref:hypothetical protein n=1 Tax=Pseudomonas aeruginosa TaxID=287 RepID=UPI000B115DDC|nr:hypothetical protein [Pseudomonas aeruginosa]
MSWGKRLKKCAWNNEAGGRMWWRKVGIREELEIAIYQYATTPLGPSFRGAIEADLLRLDVAAQLLRHGG